MHLKNVQNRIHCYLSLLHLSLALCVDLGSGPLEKDPDAVILLVSVEAAQAQVCVMAGSDPSSHPPGKTVSALPQPAWETQKPFVHGPRPIAFLPTLHLSEERP